MRGVLPLLYGGVLDQTFFQKWLRDPLGDRDSEHARFSDVVDQRLSKSEEWAKFIQVLDQMARRAGSPETPADLPFRELVNISGRQPGQGSEVVAYPQQAAPTASDSGELPQVGERKEPGKRGRPPKNQTGAIHAKWAEMGKPKATARVCDKIAAGFFAEELKGIAPGTPKHKAVRERVRKAIQRSQRPAAT